MAKFLHPDFFLLLALVAVLFVVHEAGHYIAYRALGIRARLRRNILIPGIDPVATVSVPRWKGVVIALSGFIIAGMLVNAPAYVLGYQHRFVLLLGGIAGSIVDFVWAISMLPQGTVTIEAR